jgi:hypothetical protein
MTTAAPLLEHYRFHTIEEHPPFEVVFDGARERDAFDVAAGLKTARETSERAAGSEPSAILRGAAHEAHRAGLPNRSPIVPRASCRAYVYDFGYAGLEMSPTRDFDRGTMATASADRARKADGRSSGGARRGVVVTYALVDTGNPDRHEARTRLGIATKLAELKGFEFAGEYDRGVRYGDSVYFVPSDALVGVEAAEALGVHGEDDLFGGVVPHPFVATKAITHPLFDVQSRAPPGWAPEFPQAVAGSVLDGFSAFAPEDAQRAGAWLLERGPVRVKRSTGIGGRGQYVVKTPDELSKVISSLDAAELSTSGVVVEENLEGVTTYSVGQVRVADLVATYCGTQRLTTNNRGAEVYGGSDLFVVRGDFDVLLGFPLADPVKLAIAQARAYDAAAYACFAGFFASRRNYDMVQGIGGGGRQRSGVLEQSWRIGGASGAEIGALGAFHADPGLDAVRAASVEVYGESPPPPTDAVVYFRGVDARVGALTKYSQVEPHANARRAR